MIKAINRHIIPPAMLITFLLSSGCSTSPPQNSRDACAIFNEKDDWYKASQQAYKKWGAPIAVQLAIIHQESRFQDDAAPPRGKLLWVIPWFRESSAYGYAQAMDDTWDWYQKDTGHYFAQRDNYDDAVDFIGWYINYSHQHLGISKWDTYHQYLAYHEGHRGYQRGTYKGKKSLQSIARKVAQKAHNYRIQLNKCQEQLEQSWSFWPF